jgi:hypothetical protein
MNFRILPLILAGMCLFVCGCAGYRLGPSGYQEAGARSVQIIPFVNNSPEPGLADEATSALREAIQNDGTFRLATQDDGDWIVTPIITNYGRRGLTLSNSDIRTVTDYQVSVTAHITVRERSSGKVLIDRTIHATALERVGSDFGSTERQTAPQLAQDLAQQITDLLANPSW